ncbi:MAG: N-acetylmuramoyl-L-alanine amidase [Phycisphaerae bacterium]
MITRTVRGGALLAIPLIAGCVHRPGAPLVRAGDEIVVAGQFFHTGTPVVLWLDPPNYDAYRVEKRFERPSHLDPPAALATASATSTAPSTAPAATRPAVRPPRDERGAARYGSWRRHLPNRDAERIWRDGWTLADVQAHVDLFVLHYDVCGTSRQCFKVLQDGRNLSVHFMLDVDGTIYQTLDLKERAWHAGHANDRSVGVEIANIGAYATTEPLAKWYGKDAAGRTVVTLPPSLVDDVRTPGFVARPARPEPVAGAIHGRTLQQYDLTPEQYAALGRLTAALCRVLPRIRADFPREPDGRVAPRVLTQDELERFSGVLGHYHLTTEKIDPGPAFDWDRLQRDVRKNLR